MRHKLLVIASTLCTIVAVLIFAVDSFDPELLSRNMLFADGPNHARLRGSVRDVFTPGFIAGLGAGVEAIASAVIAHPKAGATFDFMTDIAMPLPIAVSHPGDDLLSFIASDPNLQLDDVVVTAILLAVAGHETTANLLGAAMIRLLTVGPVSWRDTPAIRGPLTLPVVFG